MDTPRASPVVSQPKRKHRRAYFIAAFLVVGFVMSAVPEYYSVVDALWLRVVLLLVPWVGLGLVVGLHQRFAREDELAVLIDRQALAFAGKAALFGMLAVYHLEAAGFVPSIAWTTKGMLGGLALLVVAGLAWSKLRYR